MTNDQFTEGRLFELYQMRAVVLAEIAQLEGRSPPGRAGGPSDLSRSASQPEALIPNAWQANQEQIVSIHARIFEHLPNEGEDPNAC